MFTIWHDTMLSNTEIDLKHLDIPHHAELLQYL